MEACSSETHAKLEHVIRTFNTKQNAFITVSCTHTYLLHIRKDISTMKVHCIVGLRHAP